MIEQILRIDPKSHILTASTHSSGVNLPSSHVRHPTPSLIQQQPFISNGKLNERSTLPMPVIRIPQQTLSGRTSALITEEKPGFKPIINQPSPVYYPNNINQYPTNKGLNSVISLKLF